MKKNLPRIIALIATPISIGLVYILMRIGNICIKIYNNSSGFPRQYWFLYLLCFVAIGPIFLAEFWAYKNTLKEKQYIRYIVAGEKILISVLLFLQIQQFAIFMNYGREIWGVIVGYELVCVILLFLPHKEKCHIAN